MIINHNIPALNTYRQLTGNNTQVSKNMEKLSSGLKINRAGDDAAGLAISEKMRAQIRGLDMATKNAQDGISLIQTAEGALNETHAILQRMRELAVQSANDTNEDNVDRAALQAELDELLSEIDRIANDTEFNTKKLLNGDLAKPAAAGSGASGAADTGGLVFHIGANEGQNIRLHINSMKSEALGRVAAGSGSGAVAAKMISALKENGITSQSNADEAISVINDAINQVSTERSKMGAYQNRLEHTINNLGASSENLSAAESRIRDVDMAKEMMAFTKNNILSQASQAMLAQANQMPQGVLQLLR